MATDFETPARFDRQVIRSRRAREPLPATVLAAGTDVQYDRSTSRGPSTQISPIYAAIPPGAGSPGMAGVYDAATVEGQLPGQCGTDVAYDVANLQPGSDLTYDVANTTGHDYRIDPVARAIPKANDYRVEVRRIQPNLPTHFRLLLFHWALFFSFFFFFWFTRARPLWRLGAR